MTPPRPWFLDANVFIYAAGRPTELKVPCLDILAAVADGRLSAVTDAEVLQELLHHYHRSGHLTPAATAIRQFVTVVPDIAPVLAEDALAAMDLLLAESRLSARDALHWAIMRRLGVAQIITADKHFVDLPGVTCLDPREFTVPEA